MEQNIRSGKAPVPFMSENNNRVKDVSSNYEDCTDTVKVRLKYPSNTPSEYVYLAFAKGHQLHIVAWTAHNDSIAEFSSIGRRILYFPVYDDKTPASDPFWLDIEKTLTESFTRKSRQNLTAPFKSGYL
ncbi:MAG: hypothetical protein LBS43_12420 [Prevotellaceae bacterium]|nr:hypothetical protein [Prevotellaceae bacterium]